MNRPPRVVSLDWMDSTKDIRPDPWPALLDEERTLLAADIVCLLSAQSLLSLMGRYMIPI